MKWRKIEDYFFNIICQPNDRCVGYLLNKRIYFILIQIQKESMS